MSRPYAEVSQGRGSRISESARRQGEVLERAYSFAAQVMAQRHAMGWTQEELALKSGIDQGDISKIERGAISPTAATLARLGEALGAEWRLIPTTQTRS